MLLPDGVHPENCIYYNASFLLERLLDCKKGHLMDLYVQVREKKKMSFAVFILCIDWLYLIDVVRFNDEGELEICT
jgi:hypothetical protein